MRNRLAASLLVSSVVVLVPVAAHSAGPTFAGLGDFPGGQPFSSATALSDNGHVVVGFSGAEIGTKPFLWTNATGMKSLDGMPDFVGGARDVSADGTVVIGTYNLSLRGPSRPFLWSQLNGFKSLDDSDRVIRPSEPIAVSPDGLTVGGKTYPDAEHPSRWTAETGWQLQYPWAFPGATNALSIDGSVAAGTYYTSQGPSPFRWTDAGGYEEIGVSPSARLLGEAFGLSGDGSIVVGYIGPGGPSGNQAFRWNAETGIIALENAPRGSVAYDVSGDGLLVGGYGIWPTIQEAALWDSLGNLQSVRELLNGMGGYDFIGNWTLLDVIGISADRRVIAGNGVNPSGQLEAWIAVTSPADLNADWTVDAFDVNIVSQHWGEVGSAGDANGDGVVDIFDVNAISDGWSIAVNGSEALGVPEPSTIALFFIATIALMLESMRRFSPSLLRHRQPFADRRVAVE